MLAGKDARILARRLLVTTQEAFKAAFKGSPMERVKLRRLKRNAAVVLGNVGTRGDRHELSAVAVRFERLVRLDAISSNGSVAGVTFILPRPS